MGGSGIVVMRATLAALVLAAASAASACGGSAESSAVDAGAPADSATPDPNDSGAASDAGADVDHGQPSTTYPAFRPSMPQLVRGAGPVLSAPVIRTLYFTGDTASPNLDAALTDLFASPEWAARMNEYGVGPATLVSRTLPETPAKTLTDHDVQTWLASKLDGTHPELGPVDAATLANTLFMIVYPAGTTIAQDSTTSVCTQETGYHSSMMLGSVPVAYAVEGNCGTLADLYYGGTWGVFAAVTDPFSPSQPAYESMDDAHAAWSLGTNAVWLCYGSKPRYLDGKYKMPRTWSNAAIADYHDPCPPSDPAVPYFQAVPAVDDDITVGGGVKTKGIRVTVGQSRTIELDLLSDGPTSDAWTVSISSSSVIASYTLDRTTGRNGEKIWLTITPHRAGPFVLRIVSTLGSVTHSWPVYFGQQ